MKLFIKKQYMDTLLNSLVFWESYIKDDSK